MTRGLPAGVWGKKTQDEYETKGGKRVRIRARVGLPNGGSKMVTGTGETKEAADRALRAAGSRAIAGTDVRPNKHTMTFAHLAAEWTAWRLVHSDARQSTHVTNEITLRTQLLPQLEKVPVSKLTRGVLRKCLRDLTVGNRKGKDRNGVPFKGRPVDATLAHDVLSQMMKWAWEEDLIPANPMDRAVDLRADTSKPKKSKTGYVDPVESDSAMAHLTPEKVVLLGQLLFAYEAGKPKQRRRPNTTLRHVLGLQLSAGLRIGEAVVLRWRDLTFNDDGTLTVRVRATYLEQRPGMDEFVGPPKGEASIRDVLITDRRLAQQLMERYAKAKFKGPDDLVFSTIHGTPVASF